MNIEKHVRLIKYKQINYTYNIGNAYEVGAPARDWRTANNVQKKKKKRQ